MFLLSFVPVLVTVSFLVVAFALPQTAFSPARFEKAASK